MSKFKESFILNVALPLADKSFHTHISSWYKRINKMLLWSPDEIQNWQLQKMQDLVRHAYDNTVYYHELFEKIGLVPSDIKSFSDLEKIPPLTKEIIRTRFDDITVKNLNDYRYKMKSTGGSTGDPTRYIEDNNSWGFVNAFNTVMWKQTGYRYGDKFLALGSSSLFPTNRKSLLHDWYYRLIGKMLFNAMNLSEDVLQQCVQFIISNNIHYVYGYASCIFLLAKYVETKGLQSSVSIKACFPSSEILTDVYKETTERVFKCKVLDSYGANDGGVIAHNMGDGFKVGYNCFIQLKDPTSDFGTELLTELTNYVFPFIRYQVGDAVKLGKGYSDYYNGQVLDRVIGRTSDIIYLDNGRVLTGPGFTILFSHLHVIGYRISRTGGLEITLDIVRAGSYTKEEEQLIIDTMHKHAGNDCSVVIRYFDKLENRANGKSLYFMN